MKSFKLFYTIVFFFLFLFFFTSCYRFYPALTPAISSLGKFPSAPSHKRNVEIYFPGEKPKDTAYVKLEKMEVKNNPELPDSLIINQMKKEAQYEGVDAVLLETQNGMTIRKDKLYASLKGTGIRYKSHMGYVSGYLKFQKVYYHDPEKSIQEVRLAATISFDFDRNIWKSYAEQIPHGDSLFFKYEDRYSPYHLLQEQKGWVYKNGKPGSEKVRAYYIDGLLNKKCYLFYDTKKKVTSVYIVYSNEYIDYGVQLAETVNFRYNEQNKVSETEIIAPDIKLKEYFQYDDKGRLISSEMHKIIRGSEVLFLRNYYEYFAPSDFY